MSSAKASSAVRQRRQADSRLNLSSNELQHPGVPEALKALLGDLANADVSRYPIQDQAVRSGADLLERQPEEILLAPGSDAAIRLLLFSAGSAFGHRLILQEPNYETWTTSPQGHAWAIERIRSPDRSADGSIHAMQAAATSHPPSVIVVSWPNGPAGYSPSRAEITVLRHASAVHGHLLVIDACYSGFAGDFPWITQLAGAGCIVVASWSKLYALAGVRLAVIVGDVKTITELRRHGIEDQVSTYALQAFEQTPSVHEKFASMWGDIAQERERVRARLVDYCLHIPESGANFLHVPFETSSAAAHFTKLVSAQGYRVRNMDGVADLENCVRFTIGCSVSARHFNDSLLPAAIGSVRDT